MMDPIQQNLMPQKKRWVHFLFWVILISIILFLLLYRLNDWPSAFWDEGWTLDAARNWIEQGHLGHYLDGQPVPPYSPVRFPVVAQVALSMKIFGVGVWQGRLPSVIFTILSLGLLVYLSSKMYSRKVGIAALIFVLCLAPVELNPIYIGRQIFAEMPMMFYLFGGYSLVWLALKRSPVWGVGAALLFGVAIHTKLQVPPFWLVSIVLAIWMAAKHKQRSATLTLVGVAIGSIVVSAILLLVQNMVMPGSLNDPAMLTILFNSVILVLTWPVRKTALTTGALYSLPQIFGLIWAGAHTLRTLFTGRSTSDNVLNEEEAHKEIMRASLWGLGASWCVWYLSMALLWTRYMFPPFFIGCIFFAAYLDKLSSGFDIRVFVRRTSAFLLGREFKWLNFQAVITLFALSLILGVTFKSAYFKLSPQNANPNLAADYLENNIPAGARVESFESELFFLAPKVNFHFPPDLVSMQLVRKLCIDPQLNIDYDPLKAEPDYLVIGPYASFWPLYNIVLPQGLLQLEADIGGYQIYHINNSQ